MNIQYYVQADPCIWGEQFDRTKLYYIISIQVSIFAQKKL